MNHLHGSYFNNLEHFVAICNFSTVVGLSWSRTSIENLEHYTVLIILFLNFLIDGQILVTAVLASWILFQYSLLNALRSALKVIVNTITKCAIFCVLPVAVILWLWRT
jgi:hypothetical protein